MKIVAMAGMLFGVGKTTKKCSSVDDLQTQLRGWLEGKASPTRAEHVSVTFEFRPAVILVLPPSAPNGEGAPSATNGTITPRAPQQPFRTVSASETILNQPQNDPKLQRDVASHIVNSISAFDSSAWAEEQVARGAQGWTFTYSCQDSLQAWSRKHEQGSARPAIAEYSGVNYKDGFDPINTCRLPLAKHFPNAMVLTLPVSTARIRLPRIHNHHLRKVEPSDQRQVRAHAAA